MRKIGRRREERKVSEKRIKYLRKRKGKRVGEEDGIERDRKMKKRLDKQRESEGIIEKTQKIQKVNNN